MERDRDRWDRREKDEAQQEREGEDRLWRGMFASLELKHL